MDNTDAYFEHFKTNVLPLIQEAEVFTSYAPEGVGDFKFWTELGAGIMYDKPIVVVVHPGREIPAKLEQVADRVVHADITTEEGQRKFLNAVKGLGNETD